MIGEVLDGLAKSNDGRNDAAEAAGWRARAGDVHALPDLPVAGKCAARSAAMTTPR